MSLAVAVFVLGADRPLLAQGTQNYIVTFRAGTAPAGRAAAAGRAGAAVRFNFSGVNAAAVAVPNANALARLRNDAFVLAVIPDRAIFANQNAAASGGGKPGGGSTAQVLPAGVTRVGSPTTLSNGDGIGVAILDTGVDLAHADLTGTVNAFSAFGGSCQDDNGHGTHVAGTVGARNNTVGVIGVAPNAHLYCVKVLDSAGSGSDATLMAGLDWVLSQHASVQPNIRVVNMSLGRSGSEGDNPALHQLIQSLESAGVAVVVSAGNTASVEVSQMVPAAYAEVIAVASTTALTGSNQCRSLSAPIAADTASYFTTDGLGVSVSAPGEDAENVSRGCMISSVGILSTRLGGGTTRMSGTSMAAPHVAGVVARYFQQNASYTVSNVRQYLQTDATRQGTAPLNSPTASYSFDGEHEGIAKAP
jgi:subtilisin